VQDRSELLDDYDRLQAVDENLESSLLMIVYISIIIALLVILPKIYIKNQIYYVSRDIGKLSGEYSTLKEENIHLKQQLESMKFKNQILDTLF